ncbi:Pyridoxal phosphate-dependent transferase major region subdomain 1 [Penicillium argentinense]|uniref:Pyridoxal phosphate-dependent transferase major region subdomain 1 n=1 Tax=Penicillium argentinense TaxID=1131581 RepID=A0A9W9K185_9EURO|nr:Pyridoxal phosphate-dependent transferase major region subdomain 1 [Penicillium argentinense]KAJ5088936.1 Pyridoxal phosphate-dependent transferase major region subdomain 1 [Penicillium argentinense]
MASRNLEITRFGHEMRRHFSFAPGYTNLNHGSFGASPKAIRDKAEQLREECETTPCPFIKYRFPELLDESRVAASEFLGVPLSSVVFVANATTGVNTVLRNMIWNPDGRDEILQFDIIYGACGKTTNYISEVSQGKVRTREIRFTYPLDDLEVITGLRNAIHQSRRDGYRPRMAIFDTVSSNPALRLPFEELTALCREEGVLSLIDGAHGIGQIELGLSSLDPDFFVSNCHKWLFTPRTCAILYVPVRNQSMMRSTLPTSHGFVPRSLASESSGGKSDFVSNFEFFGTTDNFSFLTVADAIRWRQIVCGGEDKIRDYCFRLAREGGLKVARILGARILDNDAHSLTKCSMINILLPLRLPTSGYGSRIKTGDFPGATVTDWMQKTMIKEYKTFMPVFPFQGSWWVRLSGQVYLEQTDFEWAGWKLKELCERLEKQDFV